MYHQAQLVSENPLHQDWDPAFTFICDAHQIRYRGIYSFVGVLTVAGWDTGLEFENRMIIILGLSDEPHTVGLTPFIAGTSFRDLRLNK